MSSEHINEKGDGPYRGFGYLSLFSDPKAASLNLKYGDEELDTFTVMVQISTE